MTTINILEILVYLAIIVALTPILGGYMKRVFSGERTLLDPVMRPVERGIYKVCGVDASKDQSWVEWTVTMLIVNAASLVILYAMQRLQKFLPFNPNGFGAVSPDSSWNTAVSFTTNTNWQGYSGESTMSHFTQMAGLALHNFLSAATGIAIAVAIIRGIAREKAKGIGNFWYDCTRAILWVLLPISFIAALFLVSRGVVQNFRPDVTVKTVEGVEQKIAQGPVASQEAIKELGTNGGGFFNANSAHPYENPTPGTNFLEMLLIFAVGAGLTNTLGRMTGSVRHGWAVFAAMALLFVVGVFVCGIAEQRGNPIHQKAGVAALPTAGGTGGNMEGKEVRFGIGDSALFATVTTDASCGAINSWHDSFTPIGGLVPLGQHRLGRDHLRRRRGRPLRDVPLHRPLGLHRGAHGRPDARVPRQEDRGARGQARDALGPDPDALHPGFQRRGIGPAGGPLLAQQPGPPRLLRDPLRLHVGRRQQRLRLRGSRTPTRSSTTPPSASTCSSAASSC